MAVKDLFLGAVSSVRKRFYDNFAGRSNTTGSLGTATDGSKWTAVSGTIEVNSGKAKATATTTPLVGSSYPIATVSMPTQDNIISIVDTGNGASAAIWVQSSADWWMVALDSTFNTIPGNTNYTSGATQYTSSGPNYTSGATGYTKGATTYSIGAANYFAGALQYTLGATQFSSSGALYTSGAASYTQGPTTYTIAGGGYSSFTEYTTSTPYTSFANYTAGYAYVKLGTGYTASTTYSRFTYNNPAYTRKTNTYSVSYTSFQSWLSATNYTSKSFYLLDETQYASTYNQPGYPNFTQGPTNYTLGATNYFSAAGAYTSNQPYTSSTPYTSNIPYTSNAPYTSNNPYTSNDPYTSNLPYTSNSPYTSNVPYTSFTNATTFAYQAILKINQSVGDTVSSITSAVVSTAQTIGSILVSISGNQITAKAYSDTNLVTQIGSDLVYTATGATVNTTYGISLSPTQHAQSDTIGASVNIERA
jgi:hypothetical protein